MAATNRRDFLRHAGLGLYSFSIAGVTAWLTPRDARARGAELGVLDASEAHLLEAIGEAFAPGAAEAGIAWFVDSQLAVPANDSLLMARYFNVAPPYAPFYRASLVSIDELARQRRARNFAALEAGAATELLRELLAGQPDGWAGPPALLVYLVLRNDAVDVVYGTTDGFQRLGIPYMPHILPPTPW
ncbi:MAG: gluconate 2-dehydrogenase subunit 3 family protein [Gammaproteobacteria bacterium]|nr:MAG: gluconate 2-dehydrogenase subunit 3 family protein [Gammaproteobacteria bacterium]